MDYFVLKVFMEFHLGLLEFVTCLDKFMHYRDELSLIINCAL